MMNSEVVACTFKLAIYEARVKGGVVHEAFGTANKVRESISDLSKSGLPNKLAAVDAMDTVSAGIDLSFRVDQGMEDTTSSFSVD